MALSHENYAIGQRNIICMRPELIQPVRQSVRPSVRQSSVRPEFVSDQ